MTVIALHDILILNLQTRRYNMSNIQIIKTNQKNTLLNGFTTKPKNQNGLHLLVQQIRYMKIL